jgi:PhnB protein
MSVSIAPMLSVRRGAKAVEFYKAAFGAEELFRIDGDNESVVAQLSVAGASFWVADESPEHANFSPETVGGGTVRMVMVVENPDAAFDCAVAAGATVVVPVANQYGWPVGASGRSFRAPLGDWQAGLKDRSLRSRLCQLR